MLWFTTRKTRTELTTDSIRHEYGDDANSDESETSRIFRHTFIDKFTVFRLEASILAEGNANFNDTWKDTLGREGIGMSAAVIAGIIGVLGAFSVISAAVSAGIAIPVIVVGIAACVAFYKYREHIKHERYQGAAAILDRDGLNDEVRDMADRLAHLYRIQLAGCTDKDARRLAETCVKIIRDEILKNENFHFSELLTTPRLQGMLMRKEQKLPKGKTFSPRGVVTHSAYYCRETHEFYQFTNSKALKYGVLFFDKKTDLEDYEAILSETMKHGDNWKLTKMTPPEVKAFFQSSIFQKYKNDRKFMETQADTEEKKEEKESLRLV